MKTIHFIAGLPRSGSTLLCNILSQNPKFHATSSSGVLDLVVGIRNSWNNISEFKSHPNDQAKLDVMRGVFHSFYESMAKPIIFDKTRGSPSHVGLLENLFGRPIKILATVRDIRDVVASFEKIWERDSKITQLTQERDNPIKFQTMQGRVETWLQPNQPVGNAYQRLKDCIKRGYGDRLHLIDFDDLTSEPEATMRKVYEFLGEVYFEHDFDNIVQITKEDDTIYGFKDLHTIRSKVELMKPQWPTVLGKEYERYGSMNFWKK